MSKKLITESQLRNEIVKVLISEGIAKNQKEALKMLDEGFLDKIKSGISKAWSKTKYGLSKLGTITAGGKYFGQTKAKLAAQSQMDAELAKKGNKSVRELDATLKKQFPGFPNVENKEQFIAGVQAIGQVYESIVAATKLPPGSKGYLSPIKANNIIKTLRMYVQKTIDYDLSSAYRMFNENDEKYYQENQHLLFEAAAKGPLTGEKETETEKVYKSNAAPLTLLSIGVALGAFSWIANTDWFKNLFATKSQVPVTKWVSQDTSKVLGSVQPGNGLTQTMNASYGLKLAASSKPEAFVSGLGKFGNGDPLKGIDLLTQKGGLFADSAGAKAALTDIVKNPHGHGDTLGEIFKGKLAGTGKQIGDVLVTKSGGAIVAAVSKMVPKIAMMTAVKAGAGYAAAKGLGSILGPIGVGLVAAGALVKGLRYKGLKSSRMKTLKDLLVNMNDVPVPKTEKRPKAQIPDESEPLAYKMFRNSKRPKTAQPAAAQPAAAQPAAAQPAAAQPAATQPAATQPAAAGTNYPKTAQNPFGVSTSTAAQPAAAQPAAAQPAAKVTRKKPKTKKTTKNLSQTSNQPKVASSKIPAGNTDYKRNQIGFNRQLSEAFRVLIKQLHKKNIL